MKYVKCYFTVCTVSRTSYACFCNGKGIRASQVAQQERIPLPMQETWVQSLGWEDPLEEELATHSSILAWKNSQQSD